MWLVGFLLLWDLHHICKTVFPFLMWCLFIKLCLLWIGSNLINGNMQFSSYNRLCWYLMQPMLPLFSFFIYGHNHVLFLKEITAYKRVPYSTYTWNTIYMINTDIQYQNHIIILNHWYIHSTLCKGNTWQLLMIKYWHYFPVTLMTVIPRFAATWRKTRDPDANGMGTALSYSAVADASDRIEVSGGSETQRRQLWRGPDITTQTSTWNNPAACKDLSPCATRNAREQWDWSEVAIRTPNAMPHTCPP